MYAWKIIYMLDLLSQTFQRKIMQFRFEIGSIPEPTAEDTIAYDY